MLFNSHVFIFCFLPLSLLLYFVSQRLKNLRLSIAVLSLLSLAFYGWNNVSYVPLIVLSVLVNYLCALRVRPNTRYRSLYYYLGLGFNLFFLGFFKYYDFFVDTLNTGLGTNFSLLHIALPLGISFYTLQQIAYLVDCYQGHEAEARLENYSAFVLFFPQLIAGPIVNAKDLLPQFEDNKRRGFQLPNINLGMFIFSLGLFKKVIIADQLSIYVDRAFQEGATHTFISAWLASLSFTLQLYFDFSGYSDMAVGLARLFNIDLIWNFNSPLRSTNLIEFWQRWHISLGNFITTYIFTPLIRLSPSPSFLKKLAAILLTMLIAGLWHGANWTFVIFGLVHGLGLVIAHTWKRAAWKLPKLAGGFVTFIFVSFSFVLFRSPNIHFAWELVQKMLGIKEFSLGTYHSQNLGLLLISFVIVFFVPSMKEVSTRFKPSPWTLFVGVTAFLWSVLSLTREAVFIYFNF